MGVGSFFQRIFGLTFTVRPVFKFILFLAVLACGALVAVFFIVVAGKLSGLIEKRS
jgi:hypothetical protein